MAITIVRDSIGREELQEIAGKQFGDLVKAVVDVERAIMAIGGELHADEEAVLSEEGSRRENMWGINIYPERLDDDWIEFDSMINIKPQYGNRSRGVEDAATREKIKAVVKKLVIR